jgi:dipeptidyl aminopeptidase/acylaminoacyl peptidase
VLFVSAGTLYAQGFDLTRLALTGNRSTVAQDVASVSVSDAGIVAYRTTSVVERRQFVWFDRAGREIGRVGDPDSSVVAGGFLSLSPNGRHVAMHRTVDQNRDIWLLETTRGVLSRFTSDAALDGEPQWSPNGQQVVFCSNRSGVFDLYVKSTAAPEGEQLLLATAQNKSATDWSLDGRFILFRSVDPTLSHDLWALPLDGDKKPFPVVRTGFVEPHGQFSPDRQWVAYQSNESGRAEVYIQPFPGPGAKTRISTNGGAQMRWRRDGKELFYLALDGRLMAVPIRASQDGGLESGQPVPLFPARVGEVIPLQSGYNLSYDISPDGQRFLMNTITEASGAPPIEVILNWPPKS